MGSSVSYFLIFVVGAIMFIALGCSSNPAQNSPVETLAKDTLLLDTTVAAIEEESDCVYDTSTFKFTTDAIKRYDANSRYFWDSQREEAVVLLEGHDTLHLRIGGCIHFAYSASLSTDIPFTDNEKLIAKTRWIAKTFFAQGFDVKYEDCFSKGLYKQTESYDSSNIKPFMIINSDTVTTNHVYEGFSFYNRGSRTEIVISGYLD